jgi:NAD(P)-dependent dehydrogenase (short-subunit alcohol dehydrogenase family)
MRSVVITGASTGIGWATAKLLLERGFRVFGRTDQADSRCYRSVTREMAQDVRRAARVSPAIADRFPGRLQECFGRPTTLMARHVSGFSGGAMQSFRDRSK